MANTLKGKNAMTTTQLDGLTATFLASIATCLPRDISGDVMQGWNQNPKALQKALREALCPPTETPKAPELKVWKTIKIGTGIKNGKAFCSELEKKDFRIGDWARDMLGQKAFTVATQEEDVDLVNLSVADLGFEEGARYDAICARALELGLELCPAEVGPQVRLQYPDQPLGEWFLVAMEAIRDSDGDLDVFSVGHGEDGRWLDSYCGEPDFFWDAGLRFVFRLRKQPLAT
jgi:hypothetical protein